jgi:hypothetical protein
VTRSTTPTLRGFRLTIERESTDVFGLLLDEINGASAGASPVARLNAKVVTAFLPAVRTALRESGHSQTAVGPSRKAPVILSESAGVRLALTINAGIVLNRPNRRHLVMEGIASMSDEEAYYWYAKTTRPESGSRALRALRILLSDDGRTGITA